MAVSLTTTRTCGCAGLKASYKIAPKREPRGLRIVKGGDPQTTAENPVVIMRVLRACCQLGLDRVCRPFLQQL